MRKRDFSAYGFCCWDFVVKNFIYTVEYGHVDAVSFIYVVDTFCPVITFGSLFHFHACGLYRISFAYHRAEVVVAGEA